VNSRNNPSFSKLTTIALIALTCALAGCGRKAGLDLPPDAPPEAKAQGQSDFAATPGLTGSQNAQSEIYRPPGSAGVPTAPRGEKKRIPLDAILD
jgi:predicted small lipoprotein YifL